MKIYNNFIQAKNETMIPEFLSGRTMESRYNPQRDAENLCNSIQTENRFFLVLGIGSGIFISYLAKRFPEAVIIGLELFEEDIEFLRQSETIKELEKNSLITFTDLQNLETVLTQQYVPAKFGELKIVEQKAWVNENSNYIEQINAFLKRTIGVISADYSVQAHFGKIWTSNIMNNVYLIEKYQNSFKPVFSNDITEKTAVVVAAGPSLDWTIKLLSDSTSRDKYFIISTDTAGNSLIKRNIIPDIIISIDGQSVSYNHFIKTNLNNDSSPIYAFDLCANSSAARHIIESGNKVLFFTSGHPLSSAINESNNYSLPNLFSGAGTVTITALDLAVQSGFKKILILGADFSYHNGKAYTSGTYLDTLYNNSSSKLKESEHTFSKLMFRTELKTISQNIKTTDILEAYKTSLEKYCLSRNLNYKKENDIYTISNTNMGNENTGLFSPINNSFSTKRFINILQKSDLNDIETILLPHVAWLRNNKNYSNHPYKELLKLAFDSIVSYNI